MSEHSFRDRVRAVRAEFDEAVSAAADGEAVRALRDRFLGRRSGAVGALMKELGTLASDVRRDAGREINALKGEIEERITAARERLRQREAEARIGRGRVDVSLPARRWRSGGEHPLTRVREQIEDVFLAMGYEVYDGPEVDDDYHCFEALNMPPDHPARDMQDTFYIEGRSDLLLRTHTSTGQIRYMLENPHPPRVRIICPGKVYRRDAEDATHSSLFHQIEGLVVGEGITLGDLKGTIEAFLHAIFGGERKVRFRSSFFPYTEPSVEADLSCALCGGSGNTDDGPCRVCKSTGWVEILGSGMVHPAVFEAVNARLGRTVYDPEVIGGFAFGVGIERVALMKHGIDDIRLLTTGDLRFLEQFSR